MIIELVKQQRTDLDFLRSKILAYAENAAAHRPFFLSDGKF